MYHWDHSNALSRTSTLNLSFFLFLLSKYSAGSLMPSGSSATTSSTECISHVFAKTRVLQRRSVAILPALSLSRHNTMRPPGPVALAAFLNCSVVIAVPILATVSLNPASHNAIASMYPSTIIIIGLEPLVLESAIAFLAFGKPKSSFFLEKISVSFVFKYFGARNLVSDKASVEDPTTRPPKPTILSPFSSKIGTMILPRKRSIRPSASFFSFSVQFFPLEPTSFQLGFLLLVARPASSISLPENPTDCKCSTRLPLPQGFPVWKYESGA
mmetsp:Transcript_6110/g.9376  ORF Transcript_6110/g.9376 Transcript_6110/m.9376 type:complete len:271 (+) Transcript_6110:2761-3573(+)